MFMLFMCHHLIDLAFCSHKNTWNFHKLSHSKSKHTSLNSFQFIQLILYTVICYSFFLYALYKSYIYILPCSVLFHVIYIFSKINNRFSFIFTCITNSLFLCLLQHQIWLYLRPTTYPIQSINFIHWRDY